MILEQYFVMWQQNWWLFLVVGVWELIWKGIALWKSAQGRQKAWFIVILIINSVGILPIIYLLFFQKKKARPALTAPKAVPIRSAKSVSRKPRKKASKKKKAKKSKKKSKKRRKRRR